ncbi:MAG: hypothetical protein JO142_00305 [Burkholderiales bacterium]|nr:hypothetical protein [Burkholderiales bacterium]
MRHANDEDLNRIDPLLGRIRLMATSGFIERKRGVFYLRGRATLHFHEHAGEILADIRIYDDFERMTLRDDGAQLLAALACVLGVSV